MGPNDADLIQRWQKGDASAFEALVARWQQPVGRILVRLVGRGELVQDLCQEVFLRVYRAGPRYREAGTFSTWLYRIALNVARDAGRRRRHEPVPLDGREPVDPLPQAEAVCRQREAGRVVAEAIAALPGPLRKVLVLHHYEELNFEQIARLTGTAASTLKSRFAVALRRLRTHLEERGFGLEENEP